MIRRQFLATLGLGLTGCYLYEEPKEKEMQGVYHSMLGCSSGKDPSDYVIVILDMGQSNAIGRAESDRLALTTYADGPNKISIFYKPDYTSATNGAFQAYLAGSNTEEPDQGASLRLYSGSLTLACKARDYTGNPVYIIPAGDGGTALEQNLTTPDWDPDSSGECFQTFLEYYFDRAMPIVLAANPTKEVVVIINWSQGETDAANGTATTNYATNFAAFYAAVRAHGTYSSYLTAAPWFVTLLNYMQSAGETTINGVFTSFAAGTGLGRLYTIDVSDQPRKVDLTTAQKGGFSPTASDDEHLSYLAQNARGEREWTGFKSFFGFTTPEPSEKTSNTAFDPSTITSTGVRLQLNRDNVTVDSDNKITAANNSLSLADFAPAASVSLRFKVDNLVGYAWFSPITNTRLESNSAIGTSLFAGSWSMSAWVKPRSVSGDMTIIHDIQNTSSPNNSRMMVYKENNTGNIVGFVAVGGTAVQFRTLNDCFTTANIVNEHHVAVTATNGELIRIYFDGVLQTLETGTFDGNISALNLSNYVNNTNKLQVGARRIGASTYDLFFSGMIRELTIQPGVYSQSDIDNLMLN